MTTRRSPVRTLAAGFPLILILSLSLSSARAADFAVDDLADSGDALPGDGLCADAAHACTLRAAIQESNALPGPDAVALPAGEYALAIPGPDEDAAATGDLDITGDLSILGAGRDSTVVDGAMLDRVFQVAPGTQVVLSGLSIRHGRPPGDVQGGGIYNDGDLTLQDVALRDNAAWLSGGVVNFGTLRVLRSEVSGNQSTTLANVLGGGGIGNAGTLVIEDSVILDNQTLGTGGGIGTFGSAEIRRSTIAGNHAQGNGGGLAAAGGALRIANSTISGNTTREGGGAITIAGVALSLTHVTVTGNVADVDGDGSGDGGGLRVSAGVTSLSNSIVAGNIDSGGEAPDCVGGLVSQGHNLIGDTASCNIGGDTTGDVTNQEAQLAALADNGGPTPTHALLPGSPALDAGSPAAAGFPGACEALDQRGVARPQDGDGDAVARCDIGAFELEEAPEPGGAGLSASGGGWLQTLEGRKLNFGFHAKQKDGGPHGQLQLNDKAAGVKIHLDEVFALGGVGGECGAVQPGPKALELQGRGRFNGVDGAEFRVCVEDGPDLLYLECLAGCSYDTASRTPDDALDGGNVQVRGGGTAPSQESGGQPSVLVLDPVLLSEAPAGVAQLLTVSAWGADGEPLSGAPVSLEATDPQGQTLVLDGITGPYGSALFTLGVVEGESEWIVRSAELESNVLEVTGSSP